MHILSEFDRNFVNNKTQSIISKIQRLIETKNKLKHKKKVPGVQNVDTLLNKHFTSVKNVPKLNTDVTHSE